MQWLTTGLVLSHCGMTGLIAVLTHLGLAHVVLAAGDDDGVLDDQVENRIGEGLDRLAHLPSAPLKPSVPLKPECPSTQALTSLRPCVNWQALARTHARKCTQYGGSALLGVPYCCWYSQCAKGTYREVLLVGIHADGVDHAHALRA